MELLREFRAKYGYFVTFVCMLLVPAVVILPNRFRQGQFQVADLPTVILFLATMCAMTPMMVELNWWLEPPVFGLASVIAGVFGGYVAQEKIWGMIVPTWGFLWGIIVPDIVRYFA